MSDKIVIFSKNRNVFGPVRNAVIWTQIRRNYGYSVVVGSYAMGERRSGLVDSVHDNRHCKKPVTNMENPEPLHITAVNVSHALRVFLVIGACMSCKKTSRIKDHFQSISSLEAISYPELG